ncbi:MAG: hypothetical protein ABI629_16315 [bacterium]
MRYQLARAVPPGPSDPLAGKHFWIEVDGARTNFLASDVMQMLRWCDAVERLPLFSDVRPPLEEWPSWASARQDVVGIIIGAAVQHVVQGLARLGGRH